MNKYIKLLIGALMIAGGVFLITQEYVFWGIIVIVLSALPILFFFRNEYILLTIWHLRKQNMDAAGKWLGKITNINSQLVRKQFGYYHYLLAMLEGQNNISRSETLMKKALEYGLSFNHDKAMAKLTLAGAAMSKGRKQEAEILLKDAKSLDSNNMLGEQIKMMQEQMKRVNIGRNLQNPNMRRRGKFF